MKKLLMVFFAFFLFFGKTVHAQVDATSNVSTDSNGNDNITVGKGGNFDLDGYSNSPQATFWGKQNGEYILSIDARNNPSCVDQKLILPSNNTYVCGDTKYVFMLDSMKSSDDDLWLGLEPYGSQSAPDIFEVSSTSQNQKIDCGSDQVCLNNAFQQCHFASETITGDVDLGSTYYEILGANKYGSCLVKEKLPQYTKPGWVAPEMVCACDSKKDFSQAMSEAESRVWAKCQGPLVEVLLRRFQH